MFFIWMVAVGVLYVSDLGNECVRRIGADGVIVEVHPDPDNAWSDGAQSLSCEAFAAMMRALAPLAELCGRPIDGGVVLPRPAEAGALATLRACA